MNGRPGRKRPPASVEIVSPARPLDLDDEIAALRSAVEEELNRPYPLPGALPLAADLATALAGERARRHAASWTQRRTYPWSGGVLATAGAFLRYVGVSLLLGVVAVLIGMIAIYLTASM